MERAGRDGACGDRVRGSGRRGSHERRPKAEVRQVAAQAAEVATNVKVYTTLSSPAGSQFAKEAWATCPAGKRVLGGGGTITRNHGGGTHGRVLLQHLEPDSHRYPNGEYGDWYYVRAVEGPGGYTEDWYLTAYAVCGDTLNGLQIVPRTSETSTNTPPGLNDAHASCPPGTKVIGTGGVLSGYPDNASSFQQIRPNQQGAYVFVQGKIHQGFQPGLRVTAIAVCAEPPAGWHVAIAGTAYTTATTLSTSVTSPAGEQVLGAGLTKGDDSGIAHVESVYPSTITPKVFVSGGAPYTPGPWNLAAWAVCVDR
jgi:hypothetical protein